MICLSVCRSVAVCTCVHAYLRECVEGRWVGGWGCMGRYVGVWVWVWVRMSVSACVHALDAQGERERPGHSTEENTETGRQVG